MALISLRDVSISFTLRQRGSTSIKDTVLYPIRRLFGAPPPPPPPTLEAIRNLNLE
jgi:hypothetical protein